MPRVYASLERRGFACKSPFIDTPRLIKYDFFLFFAYLNEDGVHLHGGLHLMADHLTARVYFISTIFLTSWNSRPEVNDVASIRYM
jgi:hypothetical protein